MNNAVRVSGGGGGGKVDSTDKPYFQCSLAEIHTLFAILRMCVGGDVDEVELHVLGCRLTC